MATRKPVYLIHQEGVDQRGVRAVQEGVQEVLTIAGVSDAVDVRNFGVWRHHSYCEGGELKKYHSVDWYVAEGRRMGRERFGGIQLNISTMLWHLLQEPWRQPPHADHYDVTVVHDDLWAGGPSNNFVLGAALGDALVLSTRRLETIADPVTRIECMRTLTMHELGHVFGLIPGGRTVNVEESLGKHCTNRCIMRQGLRVPDDWIAYTRDRLRYGPFCKVCEWDLQRHFQ